LIKNSGFEALTVLERQIIISLFANDTTLFPKNDYFFCINVVTLNGPLYQ